MGEKPKNLIVDPGEFIKTPKSKRADHSWQIDEPEKTQAASAKINQAISKQDEVGIQEVLKEAKFLRSAVVERRFRDIKKSFLLLYKKRFGQEVNLKDLTWEKVNELLIEFDLPEQILIELLDTVYHERNSQDADIAFYRISAMIFENTDNPLLLGRAHHIMATWEREKNKNNTLAIKHNKKAGEFNQEVQDKILDLKIRFGHLYDEYQLFKSGKTSGSKEAAAQKYAWFFDELIKAENEYDACRAKIEEAKIRSELAETQKKKTGQEGNYQDNISRAYKLAKESLDYAEKSNYKNLKIIALETLAKILHLDKDRGAITPERGEQSGIIGKKAKKVREREGYITGVDN